MHKRDFNGRVVLVTGAASGIGRLLCLRFARAGARIAALDIDEEGMRSLKREIEAGGGGVFTCRCDISDNQQCRQSVELVIGNCGGIDLLINNAGLSHRSLFHQTRVEVLEKILRINLLGAVYCTSAAIESLIKRRGMIVGISSVAGFAPLLGRTGYSAAKHGLAGFLKTLRTELKPRGVKVLLVYPTHVQTGAGKNALGGDGMPATREWHPAGRVLTAEQAADRIYDAAGKEKRTLLLGGNARLVYLINMFLPRLYERLMVRANRHLLEDDAGWP